MADNLYDVIIMGGGPAGSSAALYAARFDLRTLVIDKGLTSGSLGSSHKIQNYPGVPGPIVGADLLQTIRLQAESFGARFVTDRVIGVNLKSSPYEVNANAGTYNGAALVLATGATGRSRSIPGEDRLLGKGVSYCAVCDGAFFRNQSVAVVGNHDEALEETLLLTTFVNRVHLLSPTPALRAGSNLQRVSNHPKVQVHLATSVQEITGKDQVEGARIRSQGREEVLPVQGIFIYLQGNQPQTDYLLGQLETLENGCLRVDANLQTSVPGVFAVGDMLCEHIKQAVIAASEGAVAAIAAEKYLRGRSKVRLDWR